MSRTERCENDAGEFFSVRYSKMIRERELHLENLKRVEMPLADGLDEA